MKKRLGIYIHIPFCASKCSYCDFYSLQGCDYIMPDYQEALLDHIDESSHSIKNYEVDSIYFGGGTPSYYGADRIVEIFDTLKLNGNVRLDSEVTVECNPDSISLTALKLLRAEGVNRLSIGIQASDPNLLKLIGRRHNFLQAQKAFADARKAGFDNISVDLMYGLPSQTKSDWSETLSKIVEMHPEHISCYGLKLEPGTRMYKEYNGSSILPDDDAQADMYLYTVAFLKEHGYEQYEISNFAKPGFASKHNLKYWLLQEYAGFGPGAHSDFGDVRYGYLRDIDRYIAGELVLSERETISRRERDMEYIMLRLRLARGADPREFENAFRERFNPLAKLLHQYAAHGLACQNDDGSWRLTPKGFLVSNQIIGALQEELSREKADRLARAARGDYRVID